MSLFAPTPAPRAHHSLIPHWLTHLGPLGLFVVAVVDSSIVPLPIPGTTDLLLLWLVSHKGDPWLLAACALSGSIFGGYTTWHLGLKGGEAALRRWVSARLHARIVAWVGSHPVLAVFLPAILPPPIPLSPFILASGALGVSRPRFLAAYSTARALRYSLISWLAVSYGRHIVRLWSNELEKWSAPLLWTFLVLLVAGLGFGIWKFRRHRQSNPSLEPETVHAD
ncbi:MAG: membrane-associated protein [Terracidiphilus sp.]|jgi:membrane protein YqaA with SNARE-associated domain